jgi:hypothetical protein
MATSTAIAAAQTILSHRAVGVEIRVKRLLHAEDQRCGNWCVGLALGCSLNDFIEACERLSNKAVSVYIDQINIVLRHVTSKTALRGGCACTVRILDNATTHRAINAQVALDSTAILTTLQHQDSKRCAAHRWRFGIMQKT